MKVGVIGAGGWGTALAIHLFRKGIDVSLWVHSKETFKLIKEKRENIYYLPGFIIPEKIKIYLDLEPVVENSDSLILVVPSQHMREILTSLKETRLGNKTFLIASKGIEVKTGMRMSEVFRSVLGKRNLAVLSGPNFSKEVALRIPTASTVASFDIGVAKFFQRLLTNEYFRVYTTNDMTGVELGGSLKNPLAIAAGISDGLGYGANTKSALITRGVREMVRFGSLFGANEKTFFGLSGIGDLVATSFSPLSRNRWFGEMVGRGIKAKSILSSTKQVIEGVYTVKAVYEMKKEVEMPIVEEVYRIIYEDKSPILSVKSLMERELKEEF